MQGNARQNVVFQAVSRVLRPVVRLCLSYGITYPMLLEELKRLFVSVADREFKLDAQPQTDSRLTLLTGVHRKDVRRIRSEVNETTPPKPDLSSQVLARWLGDERYLDADGRPKPLRRSVADGGQTSFEALVAQVSKDIRSRPLLDEWLNAGFIDMDNTGALVLNETAFLPQGSFDQTADFLASNVSDHLNAAVSNLRSPKPLFFERAAFTEGLTPEQVEALQHFVRTEGMSFLRRMNREHMKLEGAQKVPSGHLRMNTGVYCFVEPVDSVEPDVSKADHGR